jgi:aminoacylase
VIVKAQGPTGHGSRFIKDTAPMKLMNVANKALAFRKEQEHELGYSGEGCTHAQAKKLGDVTTVNLTMLEAGVTSDGGHTFALNVIPTEARAGFDIRVSPSMDPADMQARLTEWTEAEGVSWDYAHWTAPLLKHHLTSTDRTKNAWWGVLEDAVTAAGFTLEPEIFPAGTDSRFIRALGVPAFGFSPMANTPILLHEHNEYIDEGVFLEGVDVYVTLIEALGSFEGPVMIPGVTCHAVPS